MSDRIDTFTNNLRTQLHNIDERLSSVKTTIESTANEDRAILESKLDDVKANLKAKKNEFNAYREKIKELEQEKETEVKSTVEEWKTKRETKKLNRRADRAEDYAATGVFVAMAAMDEAEAAILEAISARLDADNALKVEQPIH